MNNDKKGAYYFDFRAQDVPYLNTIVLGGLMTRLESRKTDNGVKYLEGKILTVVDLHDINSVFFTDKSHVTMPMRIPIYFYPLNARMKKQIDYIELNVKDKDMVVVRGFMDTIEAEVFKDGYEKIAMRPETVLQGVSLQHCFSNFADKEMGSVPVGINYLTVNAIITGIEYSTNRKAKTIAHMSLAAPRILPRNIGIKFSKKGGGTGIDIYHAVFFTEEASYLKEHFHTGDVVEVQGRFIKKFFERKLFNKLDRHFIIDAFAISMINKEQQQKKRLVKAVATKMAEETDDEIKNIGEDLLKEFNIHGN